jgi:hypothetical protein
VRVSFRPGLKALALVVKVIDRIDSDGPSW